MTETTVTLTLTDEPSRSKQAGPCWIAIDDTYATRGGKALQLTVGATITVAAKVNLRRVTRTQELRDSWTLVVTGDPADVVTVQLGSPQGVAADITGVREA